MEVRPPELSRGGRPAAAGVSVVSDPDTAVIEVEVHGRWGPPLAVEVCTALRDCLAQGPAAVIVDLTGLSDLDAASGGMWLAAGRAASRLRPPVQLVLCLPPSRRLAGHLRGLGAVRFLPMFATMRRARDAVAGRARAAHRLQMGGLAPGPDSARVAADAVGVACAAWGLSAPGDTARQVVADLVTHADSDMTLEICLRGADLYLAIGDRGPRPLGPPGTGPGRPIPHPPGCRVMDVLATASGTTPTREGRLMWAVVPAPSRPR